MYSQQCLFCLSAGESAPYLLSVLHAGVVGVGSRVVQIAVSLPGIAPITIIAAAVKQPNDANPISLF
jgi:hypothetical protein